MSFSYWKELDYEDNAKLDAKSREEDDNDETETQSNFLPTFCIQNVENNTVLQKTEGVWKNQNWKIFDMRFVIWL